MVVTVPVKDKGFISKKFMTLLTWLFGSQLTWAMHWALVVDKTAFELQRPRGRGKPYLKASIWPEEKVKEIISSYPVGLTEMNDEEILKAGKHLVPFSFLPREFLDSHSVFASVTADNVHVIQGRNISAGRRNLITTLLSTTVNFSYFLLRIRSHQ